ncbi:MAG: ABC transporter permease [Gemmataceae bacterium]
MIQPRLAWELARKDLALFAADRRGMLLCFAVPVLLASAFGAIFHQPADGPGLRPRVWLVCEDDGPVSARVVAALRASPHLNVSECGRAAARRRLASEASGVAVVLPPGFGKALRLDRPGDGPRVELWHHPCSLVEAKCAEGLFTEVAVREAARELFGTSMPRFERPFSVAMRAEPGGGALSSNAYSHSFCGMTLQYLLFWGMDSGLLLLRERRQGIWRRLRAAPVSRGTLIAGKALATALVALAQIAVTFAFGAAAFGVTITGSALGFVLVALAAAVLSSGVGLLVAAVGGSENRARSVSILAILSLSLLGGLWLPSFLLPPWAQTAALALPTTWAARGLEGVCWQGMGLTEAARCAAVLAAFGGGCLAFAWWRLVQADAPRGGVHGG